LCRGAFKQAATAAGEQGIAAEQGVVADVAEMSKGMAGAGEHLESETELVYLYGFASQQRMRSAGNGLEGRAVYGYFMLRCDFADAADMIGMVMGNQNGNRVDMPRLKPS
jgi:hypothetical protein